MKRKNRNDILEVTKFGDVQERFVPVPNDERVEDHLVEGEVVDCRLARLTRIRREFEQFGW